MWRVYEWQLDRIMFALSILITSFVIRNIIYAIVYKDIDEVPIKFIISFNALRWAEISLIYFTLLFLRIPLLNYIIAPIGLFITANIIETKTFKKITKHKPKNINYYRVLAIILSVLVSIIIVISLGKDGKEAVSRIIAYPAFGGYQNEIDVIGW